MIIPASIPLYPFIMNRFALASFFLLSVSIGFAQSSGETESPPTISEKTAGMERSAGFFDFYWDEQAGKIWLQIDRWDEEFLYVNSLPTGIGSNDIGLDRGQLGRGRVVEFRRVGPKVLLVQPNYSYRAISDDPAEQRAVDEAFAESTLWGFEVAAEEEGRVLVDAGSFFLRDAHNVSGTLSRTNQGSYKIESSRSAFHLPRTRNFPKNTEIEVTLTFTGDSPGRWLRQVVPSPEAVTVRQHHSFVELPDGDYAPRRFDPRAGIFGVEFMDFATPIGEPIVKRFISRHRLRKKDPDAVISEPVEPIVYYLDRGAPEPIRSALIEGARWWNQAFEAAGYRDAFQVELLPEDADPMDVRYNLIQWVHRSTRGWSYGSSVRDPRTGEIIKGQVTLGSLRVRQDYLIAEALLAPYEEGKGPSRAMEEMALARLRQLSAHEVGHTIGLAHNFAASASGRASVMDYPHPLIKIRDDGSIDLSDAYDVGIGEWDKVAIAYAYQDFPAGTDEAIALGEILERSRDAGLIFISDADARAPGGAHPTAHLWDNGRDAIRELDHLMRVRALALERFSENNIREGAPLTTLEEVLVPLYLLHRYQLEAVGKILGGVEYTYTVRGDGQTVAEIVPADLQRRALEALLRTIEPEALALPESLLRLIPPRAFGYSRGRETFDPRTGPTFDALAPVETVAGMTFSFLLHPERAARLVTHHARDRKYPSLDSVIDETIDATWKNDERDAYHAEIARVVDDLLLDRLMSLAANERARTQVRAIAWTKIDELREWLSRRRRRTRDEEKRAHLAFAAARIERFQDDPDRFEPSRPVTAPDGSPIGLAPYALDDCSSWR